MGLIKTIIAFFNFKGRQIEMEVEAANIKNGVALLHPKREKNRIFAVEADIIRIMIDNTENNSVDVIEKNEDEHKDDQNSKTHDNVTGSDDEKSKDKKATTKRNKRSASDADFEFLTKKSFSMKFYQDEKEEIVSKCKDAGAKRDEFLLACVRVASPKRVEAEMKRIRKTREQNIANFENELLMKEKESGLE